MILVTGATGNIGRHLVPDLLESNQKVRVLVRNPAKAEVWAGRVEVVVGNLDQPESFTDALKGVEAVFLLAGGDGDGVGQARNAITALESLGARPHLVLLSSLGAEDPSLPLAKIHADREALIKASGLPYTLLRPGMFMTNTFSWARSIKASQTVFNPYALGSISPIDPADIARVAAVVLTKPGYQGRTLELTGPQALTTPEQVAALEKALGQKIHCQEITVDQSVEGMMKAGFPERAAKMLGQLTARVRGTEKAPVVGTVLEVTGKPATTFAEWAVANASVWKS